MKTIIQGNLEALKEYKYFECKTCGWIGKAEKSEYEYCGDQHEGDSWRSYCPCCKHRMFSIEDRHRLEQIIAMEQRKNKYKDDYWRIN